MHTVFVIMIHTSLPLELTVQPSLWLKIMFHDMVYLISEKSAPGAYIIHMHNQPSCYFVHDTASHVV